MTPGRRARRGPLDVVTWPALEEAGCRALVTTREGGVSTGPYASLNLGFHVGDDREAVLENRARAAAAAGGELGDLVVGEQVHGAVAAAVGPADRGRGGTTAENAVPGVDALVTTATDVVLVTLVADCVPVVLFDAGAGVLAAVHAGWRGTVAGVLEAAVAEMAALGARPADLLVALGPAVDPSAYEVGEDVAGAVRAAFGPGAAALLVPRRPGHWLFDLPGACRSVLVGLGVPERSLQSSGWSTGPPGPFYSHRAGAPSGRFALLARRTG